VRAWILLLLIGCGGSEAPVPNPPRADAGVSDAAMRPEPIELGGDRPARLIVPADEDGTPRPLVILLHGYGSSGGGIDTYFRISRRADEFGIYVLLPDGTRENGGGDRFWNATDACCDFGHSGVDDVGYLSLLIDEARANSPIASVHLIGHSNGGFMAHRMACDAADRIDSIVSLAGVTFFEEADCNPSEPTRVLQIHGTADDTVLFEGSSTGETLYPGAIETAERWASRGGCNLGAMAPGPSFDLDPSLAGEETEVDIYAAGCVPMIEVELWKIEGGGHVPALTSDFADRVLEWSLAPVAAP
jgi:polyhydroxybutyrate depolymerase